MNQSIRQLAESLARDNFDPSWGVPFHVYYGYEEQGYISTAKIMLGLSTEDEEYRLSEERQTIRNNESF